MKYTHMVVDLRTDRPASGPMSEADADRLLALSVGTLREGAYVKVTVEQHATGKWGP